jgi:hypothetical protein
LLTEGGVIGTRGTQATKVLLRVTHDYTSPSLEDDV